VYVPLNSTRVTADQLRGLGAELGVPTLSSADNLRDMIEAKLCEMDHEPRNVQVALLRDPEDAGFSTQVCSSQLKQGTRCLWRTMNLPDDMRCHVHRHWLPVMRQYRLSHRRVMSCKVKLRLSQKRRIIKR